MNMQITYTFPLDSPAVELRGKTFTGGVFCRADGRIGGDFDALRFAECHGGRRVVARIAGKPELEAALAAHMAAKQATHDRLAAYGWPQYQVVQRAAYNARAAYDRASERGYPAREAAAALAADVALDAARLRYPAAAAYAQAESYRMASNDRKAAAGCAAMTAIESGANPQAAIDEMTAAWTSDARSLVDAA